MRIYSFEPKQAEGKYGVGKAGEESESGTNFRCARLEKVPLKLASLPSEEQSKRFRVIENYGKLCEMVEEHRDHRLSSAFAQFSEPNLANQGASIEIVEVA